MNQQQDTQGCIKIEEVLKEIEEIKDDLDYQAKMKWFQKWSPPAFKETQDTRTINARAKIWSRSLE